MRLVSTLLSVILVSMGLVGCVAKRLPLEYPKSYTTPEATFETWKQAVMRLDIAVVIQSYAVSAQSGIQQEISHSTQEALRSMQDETQDTQFQIEKIVYENNRAYLRVRRTLHGSSDIEIVTMVKEDGVWKLVP